MELAPAPGLARHARGVMAEPLCGLQERDLGRVAPVCVLVELGVVAGADRRRDRPSSASVPCQSAVACQPCSPAVQIAMTCMRFSVSVPVLSVQITVVEPRVSTAERRLTSAPRLARRRTPMASASVIIGSSPSGTLPSRRPIANEIDPAGERPANRPSGTNAAPIATAKAAMIQATLRTSSSRGLDSCTVRCESSAIRPISVCIPVASTTAVASPPVQSVPLKMRFAASRREPAARRAVRAPVDREGLARERGRVDLERACEQARIGRDAIAFAHDHDVARHEVASFDLAALPVAHDHRVLREIAAERLHGLACLLLLGEGKRRVECDHDEDGDRDDGAAGDESKGSGAPQQQGERMRQLARKRARPRGPAALHELVRAGREQAASGLETRQTLVGLWRVAGGSRNGRCGHRHEASAPARGITCLPLLERSPRGARALGRRRQGKLVVDRELGPNHFPA